MLFSAKILYNYNPVSADELSLKVGDKLDVLSVDDDPWWYCKNSDGRTGMVPSNYVTRLPTLEPKSPSGAKGTDRRRIGQHHPIDSSTEDLHALRKQADARIKMLK